MSRVSLVFGTVCLCVSAASAVSFAQDHGKADQAGMEQAMQAAMTAGPHHQAGAKLAGDWTVTSKFWMDPSQPPMETPGTAHFEVIMNGLFVNEIAQMTMMGMPWEGRGTFGYDNMTKKHISTWFDSMGSTILMFEGDCADNCGTITMYSNEYMDPMAGKNMRMKTVSHMVDDKNMTMTMFMVDGSNETKMGEISYVRK